MLLKRVAAGIVEEFRICRVVEFGTTGFRGMSGGIVEVTEFGGVEFVAFVVTVGRVFAKVVARVVARVVVAGVVIAIAVVRFAATSAMLFAAAITRRISITATGVCVSSLDTRFNGVRVRSGLLLLGKNVSHVVGGCCREKRFRGHILPGVAEEWDEVFPFLVFDI